MKKLYIVLSLLFCVVGSMSAQSTETAISQSMEKMNVFYSAGEDNIHLSYTLSSPSSIDIKIVDITGREVRSSTLPLQFPGNYSEILERNNLKEGIYIMQLNWGGKRFIKRFVIS